MNAKAPAYSLPPARVSEELEILAQRLNISHEDLRQTFEDCRASFVADLRYLANELPKAESLETHELSCDRIHKRFDGKGGHVESYTLLSAIHEHLRYSVDGRDCRQEAYDIGTQRRRELWQKATQSATALLQLLSRHMAKQPAPWLAEAEQLALNIKAHLDSDDAHNYGLEYRCEPETTTKATT